MQSNTHWSRAEDAIIVYFSARKVTRVAVAELLYRRIGSNRDGLEVFQRLNQIRNVELQSGYPDFWDAGREVWDINVMDTWLVYCVFYDDPLWDVLRFDTWEEEIVRVVYLSNLFFCFWETNGFSAVPSERHCRDPCLGAIKRVG